MKKLILLYISFAFLVISALYSNIKQGSYLLIATSLMAIIIPATYSLLDLIENAKIMISKNKNRLSDYTFTDREDDLKNLVDRLSAKEHIIEISGSDRQCGKTWIAKKLCDYINYPKDFKNNKIKYIYKGAYYIDCNELSQNDIDYFFETHVINNKVVIIFDNVIDFSFIISKQRLYHFHMIYIFKETLSNDYFKYSISKFQESHIMELHNKIKNNYPGIESISEDEIHILYKITNGNIGKIHSVLSNQNSVKWVRDIATKSRTDYDDELDNITISMFMGKYEDANYKLEVFKNKYKENFKDNNDLYYKYVFIASNCAHLLNNYQQAIDLLSNIEVYPYNKNNVNHELELKKAHYYKHLWECDEALEILYKIKPVLYTARVDSLGILLAKYFVDDLHVPNSTQTSLNEFLNTYLDLKNSIGNAKTDEDRLKHKRYAAAYMFYKEKPSNIEELIESISEVIEIYKAQNNRLLANAYFMRGELYRLYGQYDDAATDYSNTLIVTYDNNIIIQTNLMVFYLKEHKGLTLNFNDLSTNEIIKLCEKNNYANKLWHRINSIRMNDPDKNKIIECFDTRIMPIL